MNIEILLAILFLLVLVTIALALISLIYARKKAKEVNLAISEARQKAVEIVKEAVLFDEDAKKTFADSLKKLVERLEKQVSEEIAGETKRQLLSFQKTFAEEMKLAKSAFSQRIASEGEKLQEEIAEFKKDYQNEAREKIYERVKAVTKEAIGRTISKSEHKKLVSEALKKAQEEGVI